MNQILVTEKLYVTPELRRKKKLYKFQFFLCVFLACLLFSYYIYAEYDRSKSEEVSQEILAGIIKENQIQNDNVNRNENEDEIDTTIKKSDKIIIVALDDNEELDVPEQVIVPQEPQQSEQPQNSNTSSSSTPVEYTSQSGINYSVESIIRLPRLGINYPVISETTEELLKISINKYWGPAPNQVGNYCVVGHNYKSKKMFGRLSEAVSGDIVELEDMNGNVVKYSVYDKYIVEPTDTSCTTQLTNGRKEVTLITCTNYGKQRLVVKAREIKN